MRTINRWAAVVAISASFLLAHAAPSLAATVVVLDEDFNDVTGLTLASTVRTIQDILTNNPSQLPAGTAWSAASAADVNVRRADNLINTALLAGAIRGFENAFATPFLVLGDQGGGIANGDDTTAGVSQIDFAFAIPAGALSITLSFDWAFNGFDTADNHADVVMSLVTGTGSPVTLQNLSSNTNLATKGSFSQVIAIGSLPAPPLFLRFSLNEADPGLLQGNTNTAFGLDKIKITAAVPAPGAAALLAAGAVALAGVAWGSRRRRR